MKTLACLPGEVAPEPGIYPGLTYAEYASIKAVRSSDLALMDCPAEWLAKRDDPGEPTAALLSGSAAHCLLLEPEKFRSDFAVWPRDWDLRRKGDKAEYELWLAEECGDRSEIRYKQAKDIFAYVESVRSNAPEIVGTLLKADGENEIAYVWEDAATGVACKCKVDILKGARGSRVVADFKTAKDASPAGFQNSVFNYNYYMQAALYLDGIRAVEGGAPSWWWLVVQKSHPFMSNVYPAGEETINEGRVEYRRRLHLMIECDERGEWPGWASVPIDPPTWWEGHKQRRATNEVDMREEGGGDDLGQ